MTVGSRATERGHRIAEAALQTFAIVWMVPAAIALTSVRGAAHATQAGVTATVVPALLGIISLAFARGGSRRAQLARTAAGLIPVAIVAVAMLRLHLHAEARSIGYGSLLILAAAIARSVRATARRAPEPLLARASWYVSLFAAFLLSCMILTDAWSLSAPIALGGDLQHPPAHGLSLISAWLPALLAFMMIGWPALNRMTSGRLPHMKPDGTRRFLIANWLCSLLLASCAGQLALTPVGERRLGVWIGLLVGLLATGLWELLVRARTVLRGPGPLLWGAGLLLIAAGMRGVIITPSQTQPIAAALASLVLIASGVLIERRVLHRVLGLPVGRGAR